MDATLSSTTTPITAWAARVRSMCAEDAEVVAQYHQQGIPTGVLAELGVGFMTRLYQSIAASPEGFVFVAVDAQDCVVGFICGTTDLRAIFRRVVRANLLRFAPVLLRRLFSMRMLRRLLDAVRYPSKMDAGLPPAELLSIVVDPAAQGGDAAGLLMKALLAEFRRRGVPAVRVMVRADFERANAYYQKHGFRLASTIHMHGHPANLYTIQTGTA